MNKILVNNIEKDTLDKQYIFNHDTETYLELDNVDKEIFLVVSENVNVTFNLLGKNSNLKIKIKVLENSTLTINILLLDSNSDIMVELSGINATIYINNSLISNTNSLNKIDVFHLVENTSSYLCNHGYSLNRANIILDVNAYIPKNSNKCISKQDNQIIEKDNSMSQINPNLYIENYDVDASHSAYIGRFKDEYLFYMMSRGINIKDATYLLLKAYLLGNFKLKEDIYDNYMNTIIKYLKREV